MDKTKGPEALPAGARRSVTPTSGGAKKATTRQASPNGEKSGRRQSEKARQSKKSPPVDLTAREAQKAKLPAHAQGREKASRSQAHALVTFAPTVSGGAVGVPAVAPSVNTFLNFWESVGSINASSGNSAGGADDRGVNTDPSPKEITRDTQAPVDVPSSETLSAERIISEVKKRHKTYGQFSAKYNLPENFGITVDTLRRIGKGSQKVPPELQAIVKTWMREDPLPDLPTPTSQSIAAILDQVGWEPKDGANYFELDEQALHNWLRGTSTPEPKDVQLLHELAQAQSSDRLLPDWAKRMTPEQRLELYLKEIPKRVGPLQDAVIPLGASRKKLDDILHGRSRISKSVFENLVKWMNEMPLPDLPPQNGQQLKQLMSAMDWKVKDGAAYFQKPQPLVVKWRRQHKRIPTRMGLWMNELVDPAVRRKLNQLISRYNSSPEEVAALLQMEASEVKSQLDGSAPFTQSWLSLFPELESKLIQSQQARQLLERRLDATNWNLTQVASELGVDWPQLRKWLLSEAPVSLEEVRQGAPYPSAPPNASTFDRLRRRVNDFISQHGSSPEEVAAFLGMHPRELQSFLDGSGTTPRGSFGELEALGPKLKNAKRARQLLENLLQQYGWNLPATARSLGISVDTLKQWLLAEAPISLMRLQTVRPRIPPLDRQARGRRALQEMLSQFNSSPEEAAAILGMDPNELKSGMDENGTMLYSTLYGLRTLEAKLRRAHRARQWLEEQLDAGQWNLDLVSQRIGGISVDELKSWMLGEVPIPLEKVPRQQKPVPRHRKPISRTPKKSPQQIKEERQKQAMDAIRESTNALISKYGSSSEELANILFLDKDELSAGLDGTGKLPSKLLRHLPELEATLEKAQRVRRFLEETR